MPESGLCMKIHAHVGGLVRFNPIDGRRLTSLSGKIGLLTWADGKYGDLSMTVCLLIDGNVRTLYVYPREIELLGGEEREP
jgi:hypothetical protein